MDLQSLPTENLVSLQARFLAQYEAFRARGISLNMARGKPSGEQLSLSQKLLELPGADDATSESGDDVRNYFGEAQGLKEARRVFTGLVGAPVEQIILGDNSSLALMHDVIAYATLFGLPNSPRPWSKEETITFLCPSPGYDRHFGLCEGFGIKMIPIPMTGSGPYMDLVEQLAASDSTVRGIWCVPRFSNPTGDVYSAETVQRLASMKTAAPDFTLFWDNAYGAHTLTDTAPELANILEATAAAGNDDRAFVFASTSKITFAGAGIGLVATSPTNVTWLLKHMGRRTIGADKVNQLRHARFLRDEAGLAKHMQGHRALLAPKFAKVHEMFSELLSGTGAATWTQPEGGYFISLDVMDGCAKRVVGLAKEAGITMVPAGQTFPYSKDPRDSNVRIAPSFPSETEVEQAAEGIALCTLLAATEKILATRGA